jgi:repressor LexA
MKGLTSRQREVMGFIAEYIRIHTYPPTIREIAEYFCMTAKGAHDHITALKKKGYIRSSESKSRTIELTTIEDNPLGFARIPILGSIAAGEPVLAEANFDGFMTLPHSMLKRGSAYFALTIQGDSMEGAGIFEDDVAIIEQQDTVRNGEIAAIQLGVADSTTATLKRFFMEDRRVRLQSENPRYEPLYCYDDVRVLGRLAMLVRTY